MSKQNPKIHIIGAGISGLIAAKVLEDKGYKPTIIEASDRVGGRVKTDIVEGYQLDHGFQVLLEAYPLAKKYLDYEKLELQKFLPGAKIFKNRKSQILGDPTRSLKLAFPTLRSSVGTIGDKFKILKLAKDLKKKSISEIFESPELTTIEYLRERGFSVQMNSEFFKPFFAGIFLEPELSTSSRMFEFVYKMFGEGMATLPKAGMESIPKQLKDSLKQTQFLFDTKVTSIVDTKITLDNGTDLETDYTIIATAPSPMVPNLRGQGLSWKSCDTLYFEVDAPKDSKPLISLVADENALINNLFYLNTLDVAQKGKKELLSVTVVKDHDLSDQGLIATIKAELSTYCNIVGAQFLKHYSIKKALPKLDNLKNDCHPSEMQLTSRVFVAGDHTLNTSLNAAMQSGERAAEAVIEKTEGLLK
ncbi:NAD(P)/FAD-dependent oxidoreductase [Dokdonia sp. Hel_I_53]|uniref:NAD(P)/FAD-dependent oxidoreductase n=1 Tax=Dokdonia sp. Hel_I_53 TaxID=1566287 RepID=UPI00119A8A9F|nr:NAD(P)/FAD-dependent oxidoreductase [Dokdonia sp. Hel_I_53]TVZ51422.1 flavin-dependent amine oxidoreductase [Dokdonia sp. Hel_I_53]